MENNENENVEKYINHCKPSIGMKKIIHLQKKKLKMYFSDLLCADPTEKKQQQGFKCYTTIKE